MNSILGIIVPALAVWLVVCSIFGIGFTFGSMLGKAKVEDELAQIMLAEELLNRDGGR